MLYLTSGCADWLSIWFVHFTEGYHSHRRFLLFIFFMKREWSVSLSKLGYGGGVRLCDRSEGRRVGRSLSRGVL